MEDENMRGLILVTPWNGRGGGDWKFIILK